MDPKWFGGFSHGCDVELGGRNFKDEERSDVFARKFWSVTFADVNVDKVAFLKVGLREALVVLVLIQLEASFLFFNDRSGHVV